MFPDIVTFFSSYGSYHNNIINKTIHLICIPLILLSALQITNHYSFYYDTPFLSINFALVFIIILSLVYVKVDFTSGVIAAIFYTTITLIGNQYFNKLDHAQTAIHLYQAIAVHVVCWILQFIGHGVFERRAPALLDNILQVFVAPAFVVLEILFLLGYKPDTFKQCQAKIDSNIKEFKTQQKVK